MRQVVRATIIAIAALMAAGLAVDLVIPESGIGLEGGGSDPDFVWAVVNNSNESIFIVVQRADHATGVVAAADPHRPAGIITQTVAPGERGGLQIGNKQQGDIPGGCFDGIGRWVVRSRSGLSTIPLNAPVDDYLSDLDVLTFAGTSSTCTTQGEVVWVYEGT